MVELLPPGLRPAAMRLDQALAAAGASARVYGSFGWQHLTGLGYLHPGSDLDLLVRVRDAAGADVALAALQEAAAAFAPHAEPPGGSRLADAAGGEIPLAPRLDGELAFDDGRAVAWREWATWRDGRARQVLVKTSSGAYLEPDHAVTRAASTTLRSRVAQGTR